MTFHDVMDDIIDIPIYPLEQGKKAKETPIRKEATRTADDKTHIEVPRRKDPHHNYGLRSVKKKEEYRGIIDLLPACTRISNTVKDPMVSAKILCVALTVINSITLPTNSPCNKTPCLYP